MSASSYVIPLYSLTPVNVFITLVKKHCEICDWVMFRLDLLRLAGRHQHGFLYHSFHFNREIKHKPTMTGSVYSFIHLFLLFHSISFDFGGKDPRSSRCPSGEYEDHQSLAEMKHNGKNGHWVMEIDSAETRVLIDNAACSMEWSASDRFHTREKNNSVNYDTVSRSWPETRLLSIFILNTILRTWNISSIRHPTAKTIRNL